jgi:hypothetical protein
MCITEIENDYIYGPREGVAETEEVGTEYTRYIIKELQSLAVYFQIHLNQRNLSPHSSPSPPARPDLGGGHW